MPRPLRVIDLTAMEKKFNFYKRFTPLFAGMDYAQAMKRTFVGIFLCLVCHVVAMPGHALERFDLPESSLRWIETLQKNGGTATVVEQKLGFVQEKDLPKLMALLDSEKKCVHVVLAYSSHLPAGKSTVGDQVAYLVDSFRKGYYPTVLSTGRELPNKNELKTWYKIYTGLKAKAQKDKAKTAVSSAPEKEGREHTEKRTAAK